MPRRAWPRFALAAAWASLCASSDRLPAAALIYIMAGLVPAMMF
jgi:hypothetical protein